MKKKKSVLNWCSIFTNKKLATTQDRQTLQNSDEKGYCQFWILRLFVLTRFHGNSDGLLKLYIRGRQPFPRCEPKQTLQGLAGSTNFPPIIPFPSLFMMSKLANLWNYDKINSWFPQFITEAQNTTYSTFIAPLYCDIWCCFLFQSFTS